MIGGGVNEPLVRPKWNEGNAEGGPKGERICANKSHPRNQKTQVVRNGDFFFILQALIKVRMLKGKKQPFLQIYELLKQKIL